MSTSFADLIYLSNISMKHFICRSNEETYTHKPGDLSYHRNHHLQNNSDNNINNNTWGCKFSRAHSFLRPFFHSTYAKCCPPMSDSHTSDVLSHSSHSVQHTWFSSPSACYLGSLHFACNSRFVRSLDFTRPPHSFPFMYS